MKIENVRHTRRLRIAVWLVSSFVWQGAFAKDIRFEATQSFPESVTWSAKQQVFIVGSVKHGTVGKVTPNGRYTAFIDDPRLVSTLGVFVDDKRNTLWVTNSDHGNGDRTTPQTRDKLAAVATFDATTGRPGAYVYLSSLVPGGAHLANDLTLDADGNAYVTDSFAPVIYRIDTYGHASVFAQDPRFHVGAGFNLNGIVAHPDGYLLVGNSLSGEIFRVSLSDPSKIDAVTLATPLKSLDGLRLLNDTHLVVVQNGGIDRTVILASTDGWKRASVVSEQKSRESMPTAAAVDGQKVYTLDSRLDAMYQPGGNRIGTFRLESFKGGGQ